MTTACARSLDFAALVDYWFDESPATEREQIEEHLFECEECSGRLRVLVHMGEGVRRAAREGAVQVVVTPSFLDAAFREGLRMREYRVPAGGSVACTVTPQDDLVIGRLQADLSGVAHLDVVWDWQGHEHRINDVPVSADAGELIVAQTMPTLRGLGAAVIHVRLLAQEPSGERLLGRYTFNHTPTPH